MARRGYPPEFRRKVLDLLAGGRKVVDVARDLELSDQTIYNWRRQDRIDRGLQPGLTTAEDGAGRGESEDRGVGGRAGGGETGAGVVGGSGAPKRPVRGRSGDGR
jgi:hypothetical protein